jgi:selenide,water dikinase
MGGRPVTALAIAGFPDKVLEPETISQIFLGGYDKLREAGVALLGGHTVRDPEVKFGYAVTGAVNPDRIWSNAGARPGDTLILTKPLGTGIVGTAIKNGRAPADLIDAAVRSMTTLNRAAAAILETFGDAVHGATDVTGFGLIGHATEIAKASGVSLVIDAPELPMLPGVTAIAASNRSGGLKTNREFFAAGVESGAVSTEMLDVCYDPQTSGGLLVAIDPAIAAALLSALRTAEVDAASIGEVTATGPTLLLR